MLELFNCYDKLFNHVIKINSLEPSWASNLKKDFIPISNKYYITILDNSIREVQEFFNYINDNTRILTFPFEKENDIDYSFMVETEQFYQINLENSNLSEISKNLYYFFQITGESDGKTILILDICYLFDYYIKTKNLSQNHLIDFIIWKLKNKLSNIFIIDTKNIILNKNNFLFYQLESCLNKKMPKTNLDLDFKLLIYKKTSDDIFDNVYWNILYPHMKITEYIGKISSPYEKTKDSKDSDETDFSIVIINGFECFLSKTKLSDLIDKNLLNLNDEPGIIIEPIDRINIFF